MKVKNRILENKKWLTNEILKWWNRKGPKTTSIKTNKLINRYTEISKKKSGWSKNVQKLKRTTDISKKNMTGNISSSKMKKFQKIGSFPSSSLYLRKLRTKSTEVVYELQKHYLLYKRKQRARNINCGLYVFMVCWLQ